MNGYPPHRERQTAGANILKGHGQVIIHNKGGMIQEERSYRKKRMNPQLTGAAGVFYVAAELSMRGMVAMPSIRNTKGADILVSNPEGTKFALIQVKTSKSKVGFWPIGEGARDWKGANHYFAFVRRANRHFEVFLEKAAVVIREAGQSKAMVILASRKPWALSWTMTGQYAATQDAEERTRRQWETFTLGANRTDKKDPFPSKG